MNKLNIYVFSLLCSAGLMLPVWATPDPTAPDAVLVESAAVAAVPQQLPKLSLIRQEGKTRLAVLDGQPRRVGAMHGSYKVVSIGAGTVVLAQGQRQVTLQLFPSMKK